MFSSFLPLSLHSIVSMLMCSVLYDLCQSSYHYGIDGAKWEIKEMMKVKLFSQPSKRGYKHNILQSYKMNVYYQALVRPNCLE
jgi:hypothetical protein